jgi:hypothetical protein
MRYLPNCESHVTDSHHDAGTAIYEAAAFVKGLEAEGNVTVISLDISLDDEADYFCNVVVERV